ncbi:MKRN2 opposite strand protein [Lampris incognitus]|uniref:MKRN2 opposite strand protein n=1 Tax=Lampris incognitus TaxID=2546036 RepID=UPI0024B575A4|nr:MKRN2 opposite strand protein [Lampris incognitus]
MERSVVKFSHCQKEIFCFSVPEDCPACGESLTGRRLEEAPVCLPSPFTNGHKTSCSFLLTCPQENLDRDIDGQFELHTGISDTRGAVYNYTQCGVRVDWSGWERCLHVPLVRPDMFNLQAQWDQYLQHFSRAPMWDPVWHRFDEESHNCFSFCLRFMNSVLAMQGSACVTGHQFTRSFVLPRVKRASKYTTLCRHIGQRRFYLTGSRREEEDEEDDCN